MSFEAKIEAVLFWKGEPVSIKELAKFFGVERETIDPAIEKLQNSLKDRGLTVIRNGDEVMLYTAPIASELIKKLAKEELAGEVSKAGVEVLSLVIYQGPIAKRDIDFIRGVNSSYIIRNLMVRGLIERLDSRDARSFVYQPTFELLAHLGVNRKEDLPDFAEVQKDIEAFTLNPEQENENHG